MSKIINTTDLQRTISQIVQDVGNNPYIVVNRGHARMVLLPYYEECDEKIEDYFEDYLMEVNKKALKNKYAKASQSGHGRLKV